MPKLPFFLRVAKHQKFEYKPMYYDQRKEDLKKRVERIEREKAIEKGEEVSAHYEPSQLRDRIKFERAAPTKASNYSLLMMIIVLALCCAFVFYIGYKWQAFVLFFLVYVLFRYVRIKTKLNKK